MPWSFSLERIATNFLSLIEFTADQVAEMPREALLGCMVKLFSVLKEQVEDPFSTIESEDEREAEVADPLVPPGVPGVDAAIQLETLKLDWREQSECGDFGFIM